MTGGAEGAVGSCVLMVVCVCMHVTLPSRTHEGEKGVDTKREQRKKKIKKKERLEEEEVEEEAGEEGEGGWEKVKGGVPAVKVCTLPSAQLLRLFTWLDICLTRSNYQNSCPLEEPNLIAQGF